MVLDDLRGHISAPPSEEKDRDVPLKGRISVSLCLSLSLSLCVCVSHCLCLCLSVGRGMGVLCRPEDKGLPKPGKRVKLEIHKDGCAEATGLKEECNCVANE